MAKKTAQPKAPEARLLKEVAEKYRLKTIRPAKYNFQGFGEIDLRTISLKEADALVEKGFPFLVLKKKAQPAEDAEQGAAETLEEA